MTRRLVALMAAACLIFGVTACGGNDEIAGNSDQQCFQEMDTQQRMDLEQYAQQQGQQVTTTGANADGTQNVCVIDSQGQQHYYRQNDGFSDYLLYSMMLGHSNTLATYGLLTGDLSPLDYVLLQSLVGVNSRGDVYHPYTSTSNGWARKTTVVKNVHVTNVYYGKSRTPVKYTAKPKPPAGYRVATVPKAKPDAVASVNKTGKVSTVPGVSAKSLIKSAKTVPPNSAAARKPAAPQRTYSKPKPKTGTSSPPGGNTAPASKPPASKLPASRPPASRPPASRPPASKPRTGKK